MNDDYVYLKLITGEQLMAIRISETESEMSIQYPMSIKIHTITSSLSKISEHVTAGPYTVFSEDTIFHLKKEFIVLNARLANDLITHYMHLVKTHEEVDLRGDEPWDSYCAEEEVYDEETEDTIESILLEGNRTVH